MLAPFYWDGENELKAINSDKREWLGTQGLWEGQVREKSDLETNRLGCTPQPHGHFFCKAPYRSLQDGSQVRKNRWSQQSNRTASQAPKVTLSKFLVPLPGLFLLALYHHPAFLTGEFSLADVLLTLPKTLRKIQLPLGDGL